MANFGSTVGYSEACEGQSQLLQGPNNLQHMNQGTQPFDPMDFLVSEEEFDHSCEHTCDQAYNSEATTLLENADSVIQTHESLQTIKGIKCSKWIRSPDYVGHESLQTISSETNIKKRKAEQPLKYAFLTRSKIDILEDGFKWRKYGKKFVKNSPNPRNYFRCSNSNCDVKKTVERHANDEEIVITTYLGKHNHGSPCVIYYIGNPGILQFPRQTTSSPIENFSGI